MSAKFIDPSSAINPYCLSKGISNMLKSIFPVV